MILNCAESIRYTNIISLPYFSLFSRRMRVLPVRIKVKDVIDILKATTHSAFPIVDTKYNNDDPDMPSFGRLRGLIRRNDIISMIYMKVFVNWKKLPEDDQIVINNSIPSRKTKAQKVEAFCRKASGYDIPNVRPAPSDHDELFDKLNELYPRYPTVDDLDISLEDQSRYFLDFSLAMDVAPPRVSSSIGYPQVIMLNKCPLFL